MVNLFVHASNPDKYRGTRIVAEMQVLQKDLEDGRSFIYVDLRPMPSATVPTHKLEVMSGPPGVWSKHECVAFPTPLPLQGEVIISPLGPDGKKIGVAESTTPAEKKKSPTGDTQLDRLLADGWQIGHEDVTKIVLWKANVGERRMMIHHRPKPKGRNGSKR